MVREWFSRNRVRVLVVFVCVLWVGCGSLRRSASADDRETDAGNVEAQAFEPREEILILTGSISYDSARQAYGIEISNRSRVEGFMNLEQEPISETDAKGLNYVQLGPDSTVISIHTMENPLVQMMEYHDGPVMGRTTVIRSKAALFVRVQLSEKTEKIAFRHDADLITVIKVTE